jgi:hypothetical protein
MPSRPCLRRRPPRPIPAADPRADQARSEYLPAHRLKAFLPPRICRRQRSSGRARRRPTSTPRPLRGGNQVLTTRTIGRRAVGLIAVAATMLVTAACSQSTQQSEPTPATQTGDTTTPSSPSGTPSSTPADGRAAVEAAYRRFWAVSWRLDSHPEAQWRQVLSTVAVDPELTRVLEGTRAQKRNGITRYGEVVPRPTVVAITGATARVKDCQGGDKSGQADARTGRRTTVGVARNPLDGFLTRGADGRWRVTDIRYPGGRC